MSQFVQEAGLVSGENVPKGEVFESGLQVGGPDKTVIEDEEAAIEKTAHLGGFVIDEYDVDVYEEVE